MKLLMIACAQSHSIDARTNAVSLFGLLEEMSPQSFPAVTPPFCFFAYMSKEAGVDESKIRLLIELDDEVIANGPFGVDFQGKDRARAIADIGGIVISKPGMLKFTLKHKTKSLACWPIIVKDASVPQISLETLPAPKGVSAPKPRKAKKRKKAKK